MEDWLDIIEKNGLSSERYSECIDREELISLLENDLLGVLYDTESLYEEGLFDDPNIFEKSLSKCIMILRSKDRGIKIKKILNGRMV